MVAGGVTHCPRSSRPRRATAVTRATPPSLALSAACCAVFVIGCGGGSDVVVDGLPEGPLVLPVDSIRLEASDRVYLGNPFSLVVDTLDGSFLVSDFFEDRVFRFGRDGSVVQTYGRPGPGPGEFSELGPAFVLGDSVIVGTDHRRKVFQLFSRDDGDYLGAYPTLAGSARAACRSRRAVWSSRRGMWRRGRSQQCGPIRIPPLLTWSRCRNPMCGPPLVRTGVPDAFRHFIRRAASSPGKTPRWWRCRG